MARISRRCYDVLNLPWTKIGQLMDRDPCALRRAVTRFEDFREAVPDVQPVRTIFFNPKSQ